MRKRLSRIAQKSKDYTKGMLAPIKEKALPYIQRIARPVTKHGRTFERNFFATTHITRVFRNTLIIAGVFSGVGLAMGTITGTVFLATAKIATIVASITLGREAITRAITDRKEVTWKNEIGQEVTGTKIQKQKLNATQTQINRLTDKFNSVSGPTEYQQKKFKFIIEETKELTQKVTINSAPTGISKDKYVFAAAKRDWKPVS